MQQTQDIQEEKSNMQLIEMDELFQSLLNIRGIAKEINFERLSIQAYREKLRKGLTIRFETKEKFLNHCGFSMVQKPLFAIQEEPISIKNANLNELKTFSRSDLIAFAKMLDQQPGLTTSPAYAADKYIAKKFN